MLSRLKELKDSGVNIYLSNGECGGIQHSKTLRVDGLAICGSTNWTNSSQANTELSVPIELNREGLRAWESFTTRLLDSSTSARLGEEIVPNRNEDHYRTARRFSIARSRSVGAL